MKISYKSWSLLFFLIFSGLAYSQCAITLTPSVTNASCPCNNGTASVTVSGGAAPYTYSWINNITPGTVTIPPLMDNSIYEQFTGNSNGAGEFLTAGVSAAGFKHRALILFDIAGYIPAGASVTNVSLSLNVNLTSGQNGPTLHYLHKVSQNWGEGFSNAGGQPGQGASATVNDATWLKSVFPALDWMTAGGAFNTTPSASSLVDQGGFYSWISAGMIADVQAWLDTPSSNSGWVLKSDETGIRQAKRYCSRENGTIQNRPALNIGYGPRVISTVNTAANLAPGIYTVTVTDANGCSASAAVTIFRNS